ncbi:hypothetical protein POTOM_024904 [Populus tomentosa]|uniref:Prolamin-like domain-containing protein n=1 Tax=Populus tomentosa TaxID=118781 RepID=A0A8X8CWK6_POPTO|nr:hypothetical protein POTOM_024904 [Populus tomentosa]
MRSKRKGKERGCFALCLFGSFFLKSNEWGYLAVRVDWDLRIVARERESRGCHSLAQFPSFASVNAYAHRPIFISLHQPKISHLRQPPTPPAQNPHAPPNSGDQVQKCHEAVPGILRCAFELVSSLSNPKFEISADCCSVVKVVEENCLAQAWVPYIST